MYLNGRKEECLGILLCHQSETIKFSCFFLPFALNGASREICCLYVFLEDFTKCIQPYQISHSLTVSALHQVSCLSLRA